MKQQNIFRSAFTMIELVFAIVIIGIVFLAIPTMIQSDSDTLQDNLVQEGIYALSAQITQDSTYYWDANSTSSDGDTNVVDIAGCSAINGCAPSLSRASSVFRNGHIQEDTHRRFHTSTANATGQSDTTLDDLDDINQTNADIFTSATSIVSADGYKNSYQFTSTITYVADNNGISGAIDYNLTAANITPNTFILSTTSTNPSNIKMLNYQLFLNGDTIAIMRNYSANIGGIEYYTKTIQ